MKSGSERRQRGRRGRARCLGWARWWWWRRERREGKVVKNGRGGGDLNRGEKGEF